MARFFVALRPDPPASARLARLASDLAACAGGRAMSAADVHLTLAFVGERPLDDADRLHALLEDLAPRWPGLALARLGTFGRGLLWAGPAGASGTCLVDAAAAAAPGDAIPRWAAQLADEVRTRLRAAGIGFDARPLHLHATLVRGARRGAPATSPAHAQAHADAPVPAVAPDRPGAFARFAASLPVDTAHWTLALGWSGADATPQRRYHWRAVSGADCHAPVTRRS